MSTEPIRLERRAGQRFEVNLPLAVQCGSQTHLGFAHDVSARGVCFYTEANLPEGAVVELILTMPAEITLAESMRVRCRGRVLRTSGANPGGRNRVAVRFESYQYLHCSADEAAAEFLRLSAGSIRESARPVSR